MIPFELFVALRHLRARRKQKFISVVTLISIGGVTAGVMALTIALALNSGFQSEFQERILGITSNVNLFKFDGTPITNYQVLAKKTLSTPGVTSVTPSIYGQALLQSDLRQQPAMLKGMELGKEGVFTGFAPKITEGNVQNFNEPQTIAPIVLGKDLAQSLGVVVGENVRALGLGGELSPLGRMPRIQTFHVSAIFESGLWDYDANWALVPVYAAQHFFKLESNQVSALEYRIKDIYAAPQIANQIKAEVGRGYVTNTWIELNRPLFSALRLEKLAMFIAIGLIVLVASLNIISTLTLMVMEKHREIAIISAMGGTSATAMTIFILQGLIIGVIGTILGDLLGSAAVWYFETYKIFHLEPQVYSIPYVPFRLEGWDLAVISALAVVVSFLATLYPARAAARVDPVESLRYE